MKKLFEFLSDRVIPIGTIFLLFFIPVYPKLPIINVIRTWVYIRLEDFLVALLVGLFLATRLYERKFTKSQLTFPIVCYWAVGAVSLVWSLIFIGPKLPNFFPHLAVLFYLRQIEYMMLFFLAFESVSRRKNALNGILVALALATFVVIVYGVGQKFVGFPAFLTMNEEFAKGVPLRLPPTARIVSTFGGHYDLAAYLVLLIPILGSLALGLQKFWQKLIFLSLTVGSVVLLLFTASRISFGVYLVGITAMLVWHKKYLLIPFVVIASFILLNLVSGASERFYKTFRYSNVVVDLSTGKPIGTLEKIEGESAVIEKIATPAEDNLPKGSSYIGVPPSTGKKSGEQLKTIQMVVSHNLATGSGEVATISGSFLIQKAFVYDISITTRFQGEWPKAIQAFERNLLLGSGYSALGLAVDGNYHRILGETGILGAISFLGIIAFAFALFLKGKNDLLPIPQSFVIGFFAGLVGLMLNAVLIDVFEASKVAFTLWLLMGIVIALLAGTTMAKKYFAFLWSLLTSEVACSLYIALVVLYVYRAVLSGYFLGDDFTWLRWAAQSSFADIAKYFTSSAGFFYRPVPKVWYFILYSIFWLKPGAYHVFSLLLYSGICILIYSLLTSLGARRLVAFLAAFLYASLAIHHENVFWISGQSSLLGTFFFLLSCKCMFMARSSPPRWRQVGTIVLVWVFAFLSMLSYDSLLVVPIILLIVGYIIFNRRETWISLLILLLPVYLVVRWWAQALVPSGDYGYRLSTLPVNALANLVGYSAATFLGPSLVEKMAILRELLRAHRVQISVAAVAVAVFIALGIYTGKKYISSFRVNFLWYLCVFVSLLPFLGLGGMAERYALLPSALLVLGAGAMTDAFFKDKPTPGRFLVLAVLFVGLFVWNVREINRIANDWEIANSVSEQALLEVKSEFFPLTESKTFIFVDTPIRYGRAWIFPAGLPDALWHLFRDAPFAVVQVSTVEQAFAYPTGDSVPVVLRFENYELKRLVAVERPINQKNSNE